jgi:regulator of replication initiation timing
MNLGDKVYNLEHSVNELKVSMATVEATLSSLAKESDLANVKATLSSLAKESDLANLRIDLDSLKTRFEITMPTLAKQEDLKELKVKFESTLPHLVTKTWLFTGLTSIIIAQIFIPSVRAILHLI